MPDILDLYTAHRLLTADHDPLTRKPTLEVAHEALLSGWPTLRAWLDGARDDLRRQRLLARRVREWHASGRDPGGLLRGALLTDTEAWAAQAGLRRTPGEGEYLAASAEQRRREADADAARQARERQLEGRARRVLTVLSAVLLVSTVAAAGLSAWALSSRQEARRERDLARVNLDRSESQRLAAESTALLARPGDPELAALLAVQAVRRSPTRQADLALQRASHLDYGRKLFQAGGFPESLAASPDGRFVAVSGLLGNGGDLAVRVWRVGAAGGPRVLLRAPGHDPGPVRFSPDGGLLAFSVFGAGYTRTTLHLWDTRTWKERWRRGVAGAARLHLSSEGVGLLGFVGDQAPHLVDLDTGRTVRTLPGGIDGWGAALSPDGRQLAAPSGNDVHLLALPGGRTQHVLRGHERPALSLAFAPDGRTLASGSLDTTVRLWNTVTGQAGQVLRAHREPVSNVAYAPGGRTLLTGGKDQTVRLWSVGERAGVREVWQLPTTGLGAENAGFLGRAVTTAGFDGNARVWPVEGPLTPGAFSFGGDFVRGLAVSPDGRTLWAGNVTRGLRAWDLASGRVRWSRPDAPATQVLLSPDGRRAYSVLDTRLTEWDAAGGRLRVLKVPGSALALGPDGRFLAAGGQGVAVLNLPSGRRVLTLREPVAGGQSLSSVTGVALGQRFLATASDSPAGAHLWDARTGRHLRALDPHEETEGQHLMPSDVALSPDETRVAVGTRGGNVRVYDTASGQLLLALGPLRGRPRMQSVRFSPDGRRLLAAGLDGQAFLWDAATGQERRVFAAHGSARLMRADFSPDGQWVVLGSSDGWVERTPTALPDLLEGVCARVLRDFLDEEPEVYGLAPDTLACPAERERTRLD